MNERLLDEGELEAAIEKALIERQPSGSGYATIAQAQDARSYPIGYADGAAAKDEEWRKWLFDKLDGWLAHHDPYNACEGECLAERKVFLAQMWEYFEQALVSALCQKADNRVTQSQAEVPWPTTGAMLGRRRGQGSIGSLDDPV